ncbi:hypothetical protein SDC9_153985 [bioreactor metagenome]|uniref:Uncharacterized protein n=1 Tax=bioreactor metagenome TaxID=1076179 RepID=A0A645EZW6_9ZZZZ
MGYTYYGQLLETAPGKILWVFQNNIGDGYYPWKHDAAIRQVTFDYRRIGVAGQSDAAAANALCRIGQNDYTGCHLYAGIKVGHSAGLAFAIRQNSFYFVTVAREDGDQGRNEFPAALVVGYCEGGKITILRKTYAGNIPPGCRIEMQLDWQPERLKCAVKWNDRDWNSGDSPAVYCNLRHSFGAGGVGLYCDRGTAEFQNLRLTPSGGVEIRSNWAHGGDGQKVIPLDAGKEEL